MLDRLCQRLSQLNDTSSLFAIDVLNEPFPPALSVGIAGVMEYDLQAYNVVRRYFPPEVAVIIDGAFNWAAFYGFMPSPSYQNVILDLHRYQCFDAYLTTLSYEMHWNYTCTNEKSYNVPPITLPIINGEWSLDWYMEVRKVYNLMYLLHPFRCQLAAKRMQQVHQVMYPYS